jgi:hypothetical protein
VRGYCLQISLTRYLKRSEFFVKIIKERFLSGKQKKSLLKYSLKFLTVVALCLLKNIYKVRNFLRYFLQLTFKDCSMTRRFSTEIHLLCGDTVRKVPSLLSSLLFSRIVLSKEFAAFMLSRQKCA